MNNVDFDALLRADMATLAYDRGTPVVQEANLTVRPGDRIGIAGESGSGKSTFARGLVGAMHPTRGSITVRGRDWRDVSRRDSERLSVQMVFQDPYSALNPRMTPIDAVAEPLRSKGRSRTESRRLALALLEEVGLGSAPAGKLPARLSGGQRQRVAIARALACDPEVLVADEPTSALDVSVQAQILNLLENLWQSRGLAIVLITHDLHVLKHATDRTLVMYQGRIVEDGSTGQILTEPTHEYTRTLIGSALSR